MMPTYKPSNGVPDIWWSGLKDESTRAQTYEPVSIPIHTPLFMTFAPFGQTMAQFVTGSSARDHYGEEIFDERSKYATIVTPFLNLMNKYGNPYLLQRLRPVDANPEASVCIALKVVKTDNLIDYRRDGTGRYEYDANGRRIPMSATVSGYYAEWITLPARGADIGKQEKIEAEAFYRNDNTARSTIYPIMELQARWFGEEGNNLGIRLHAPVKSDELTSGVVMQDNEAFTYGIEVVRRRDAKTKPRTIKNYYDKAITLFTFKEDIYHDKMGGMYSLEDIFEESYSDLGSANAPKKYSDIGKIHIYHEYLEEVLDLFYTAEKPYAHANELVDADPTSGKHLMNILTGLDFLGVPYRRVQIGSSLTGANVVMGPNSTLFLTGGSDGTMGNQSYDNLVYTEFDNFGQLETKYADIGRYPFHQVYDCGFSAKTKSKLINALLVRPDVNVTLSTIDLIESPNKMPDAQLEASVGATLVNTLRQLPESEKWGTPGYRGFVIPYASKLIGNARYRKWIPLTYEVAAWRAEYMGSPVGLKPNYGYDLPPFNHLRHLDPTKMTNPWLSAPQRERNWTNGLCHFRHKTDSLIFCPALKSVYPDDTSVLTSDITTQITCDLNYYGFVVWSNLTGNTKYSNEDLCKISDEMFKNYAAGRYDDRVVVIPNTHLTRADVRNGWSWTSEIHMYAKNMKTQTEMYLVAHRFEDLNNG